MGKQGTYLRIKSVGMDVDVKIGVFMTMSKTVRIQDVNGDFGGWVKVAMQGVGTGQWGSKLDS